MDLSKVYRLLVNKAEKKGRTREEVDEIIRWFTWYNQLELEGTIKIKRGKSVLCQIYHV